MRIFPCVVHGCSVVSDSETARHLCPWNFPGKNTEGGFPFPTPGDLPDTGIEPRSLMYLALAGRVFTTAYFNKKDLKKKLSNETMLYSSRLLLGEKMDFPGSPAVKILHFPCTGQGYHP